MIKKLENNKKIIIFANQNAALAQLVRALDCGSRGHGFESHRRCIKALIYISSSAFFI